MLLAAVAASAVFAAWVVRVLDGTPSIDELPARPQQSVSVVSGADGTRFGYLTGDVLRVPLRGRGVPAVMRRATVAIEDRRFYRHGGVDAIAVARAAVENVTSGRTVQGGSSLTMQLVRNLYLPESRYDRTLERKIREAKLADELDRKRSKAWILNRYLDNVPYGTVGGQTAVGVQAAARVFFGKPAAKLTLPEAALLAGLPQAPSLYNPFDRPERARRRRAQVLQAMVGTGAITPAQAAAAARAPLGVRRNDFYQRRSEPYVVDYVAQELARDYGRAVLRRGGLRIRTTIDPRLQAAAREAIAAHLDQPGQPAAAIVAVDPRNGAIRAMVSSSEYEETQFNYASSARRQPGSTFKAIDLMAAVREGIDPDATSYTSRPLGAGWLPREPTWSVATAGGDYHGPMRLSDALVASDNTVFAQLGADLGGDKIRQAAYDMGVTSELDGFPAESIGGLRIGVTPLEMAGAFATIAAGGRHHRPTAIARVTRNGKVLTPRRPARPLKRFTDGQAAKVIGPMKAVLERGTAAGLGIGCPAAGKTGTTNDYTDAWFIGFTPRLSTAVWVGYPDQTASMNAVPGYGTVYGATIPAPIWHHFMMVAKGDFCGDFPPPSEPFEPRPFHGTYGSSSGPTTTDPDDDADPPAWDGTTVDSDDAYGG